MQPNNLAGVANLNQSWIYNLIYDGTYFQVSNSYSNEDSFNVKRPRYIHYRQ